MRALEFLYEHWLRTIVFGVVIVVPALWATFPIVMVRVVREERKTP